MAAAGKKKPSVLRGAVIAYLGLVFLVEGGFFMMIVGAVLIGFGVTNIIKVVAAKEGAVKERTVPRRTVTSAKKSASRTDCPPSCAGEPRPEPKTRREKDLEQLESLYSAGLYDKQEYIQKRRKILSGS